MDAGRKFTLSRAARYRHDGAPPATIAAALLVGIVGLVVSQLATASTTPSQSAQPSPAVPGPTFPLRSEQVATHLGKTADWYHHLETILQMQLPGEAAARDWLLQRARIAVQLALEAGKATAAVLNAQSGQSAPTASSASSKGFAGRLDQAAVNIDQRIDTLQSRLDALGGQITHARGKEQETLLAQKAQVSSALGLAREVQQSVQDMENFETSSIAGDNASLNPLEGQIADIERSIPGLRASIKDSPGGRTGGGSDGVATGSGSAGGSSGGSGAFSGGGSGGVSSGGGSGGRSSGSSPSAGAAPSGSSNALRVESAGIIPLVSEWLSLTETRRQLNAFGKETQDLQDEIRTQRASLVREVREVVGTDLAISHSTDPTELLAQRAALEADSSRFKRLSTVLVPLGEQALVVESVAGTIGDWRTALNTRMATIARYLALRIGVLLGSIAIVLVISEIWRRATFRYLHDLRRRRQFLVLRRVAVGIALTFVIVFGLISEVGSLATYIGFVTAGIAVALQNVILAVVAYFFLIGRYGVRAGDRITLSGVTGRVADVGLIRIYLMELAGADLHATGRMVVLSNAVLFQPTALFKQIPGADYVWHTVTLTIAATADVAEAHKRLKTAANQVYEKYRAAIDRQHATMQRFMDFESSAPQPEVRVRLTENGLECSVRYPVELDNAAVIDQQMLKALRDALEHDSQFKLVSTGAVMLKFSDT